MDITYEIKKVIGVLKQFDNGWARKVSIVNWNNSVDKIDIREWSPDSKQMSRGITMTFEEFEKLKTFEV